jgi:hypothetical protein
VPESVAVAVQVITAPIGCGGCSDEVKESPETPPKSGAPRAQDIANRQKNEANGVFNEIS